MQSLAMAMPAFRKSTALILFIENILIVTWAHLFSNPGPWKSLLEGCVQRSHECDGHVFPFLPSKCP